MQDTAAANIEHAVSFADYCQRPGMNVSTLVRGFVSDGKRDFFSPRHLKAAIDGKLAKIESKQTQLGHALHARLLEPERYHDDYLVASRCCAEIKNGARQGHACGNTASLLHEGIWYCGIKGHAPAEAVSPPEYVSEEQAAKIEAIASEMVRHKAMKLLRSQGGFEESFFCDYLGVLCKGRVDKDIDHPPGTFPPCVIDIKTVSARRFTDNIFFWQAKSLHYPEKMAWYCKLLESIDGIKRNAIWVIMETEAPYTISVRQCPDQLLELGWQRIRNALVVYAECLEKDEWPDEYGDLRPLNVPEQFDLETY